ncbi:MAG TPA: hypothetical protein VKM72_28725 [Thermoanaerobaculia bacterium]|nr:hypothetical protein [Thermoanaerobaculia bacterium]
MNSQVREVGGLGCVLGCCLAAPKHQQLAQPPAHETGVGVKAGQAFSWIEGNEHFQKPGRLGTRPGEGGVDRTETGGRALAW